MEELNKLDFYKNFKNTLYMRLCFTIGIPVFWTIKTFRTGSFDGEESFLPIFIFFSNLIVISALIFSFLYAKKRQETYETGSLKNRVEKYLKATMYRYSAIEISPALFMVGFIMFGKFFFVLEAIAFYILLGVYFPSKRRLINDLKLTTE